MSFFSVAARLATGFVRAREAREARLDLDFTAGARDAVVPAVELRPLLAGRDPRRFEFKYWVPESLAAEVVHHVSAHVVPDKYGEASQCNTSLYLDTPDLDFYHSHIEASPDRFKLRVRAYGDPPAGMAFFETKRKVGSVTIKTRSTVPLATMQSLLEGTYDELPELKPEARQHLESFLYQMTVRRAEPYALVRARREAFASADPADDIRVTFDRDICFQRALGPTLESDPDAWVPIDGHDQHAGTGPHALLELKFPQIAPLWMRQLTDKLEMMRVGYSKYCWAVETLMEQRRFEASLRDSRPSRSRGK